MFCYQKSFFEPTRPVDEKVFYQLVRDKASNDLIDGFRQSGDAALKRKLPAFIFQAMFDETVSKKRKTGAWRKQAATRLTGLVVMDIDHVDNPQELYDKWQAFDFEKLGILFIYITPSGKGIKVVFKANVLWGNLIDNQHKMAELLGVTVDESCKDASRMSFICKEEDILFINNELFTYENKEFGEKYDDEYRNGISRASRDGEQRGEAYSRQIVELGEAGKALPLSKGEYGEAGREYVDPGTTYTSSLQNPEPAFKGIPYSLIITEWWKQNGGEPEEGERNTELHRLAVHLRTICDNKPEKLLEIMPNFGLEEVEMRSIIASATKDQPKGTSRIIKGIVEELKNSPSNFGEIASARQTDASITLSSLTRDFEGELGEAGKALPLSKGEYPGGGREYDSQSDIDNFLQIWGERIEELSEHFPILKDITKGLKRNQYPAALIVSGGFLMTLMTRCTYRFYHRPEELRRLNNCTLIVGDPASGKSFATRLYKLLMAPVFASDKVGKEAINAYRELMKTKGANKEKPKKPKVVVRVHPARTSNAQFIQDMVNAIEVVDGVEMQLHTLTFDTELDNTLSIQKGGSWIDKNSLELKAFHNEEDGQAYSNVDSIFQEFNVTWNYIYTGTPIALKKKVNESNFGSGLATRLTCIPLPSTNFEMMTRESIVDYDSDNRLKAWASLLDKTKGELSVQKIVDELYEWTARRMADAQENDSRADEMLLKRCAYHGLNFAAPFIVMRHWDELKQDGEFWCGEFQTDEVDWQLAELIVNMQYACQKHYFGAMAEAYFDNKFKEASVGKQRRQKTVDAFNRLPDEFTTDDVIHCFNLKNELVANVKICRLQKDGLVKKSHEKIVNSYKKVFYHKTGAMMVS